MSRTARALVVTAHGDSSVLAVLDREVPDPGPGQLQVEVTAAGVNFIDVYQRQGVYPVPTPFVQGMEGAGVVVAVGEGASAAVGDRVAWAFALGSAASLVNVAAKDAVPVPADLPLDVAAAAMLQGMTAHYLCESTYPVAPGDWVLVHAAAGGVGQLLVQMCRAKGAHVIATAGSTAKLDIAAGLGAEVLVDYSSGDLAAQVREATGGEGVHVAFDGVGAATFDGSLAALRRRGTLVLFGGASGQVPPLDLQRLNAGGSLYVTRPTLAHYIAARAELEWRAASVLSAIATGELAIQIGGRYPLADAASAYDALEARRTTGKLLLLPQG